MIRVEWAVDHFGLRLLNESYSNYTMSYILPYQRELAYNLRKRNRNRLLNVKHGSLFATSSKTYCTLFICTCPFLFALSCVLSTVSMNDMLWTDAQSNTATYSGQSEESTK